MTAILPAPTYVLTRAAWIPTLVIWHADGRFTRLEGAPCDAYAARAGRELAAAAGLSDHRGGLVHRLSPPEVTMPEGWERQLAEFAESLVVLPRLVEAVERNRLHRSPGPGEWSVHVIVCHLVLNEINAATSLRLILTQDCPVIAEIEDDRCVERFAPLYPDTATALRTWRALREDNVRLCASVSTDDLERVGRVPWHAERISFRHYVASRGRHDRVHIDQIRSALSG